MKSLGLTILGVCLLLMGCSSPSGEAKFNHDCNSFMLARESGIKAKIRSSTATLPPSDVNTRSSYTLWCSRNDQGIAAPARAEGVFCVQVKDYKSIRPGFGRIFIVRGGTYVGDGGTFRIAINDRIEFLLGKETFLTWEQKTGPVVISAPGVGMFNNPKKKIAVNVEEGKSYFLLLSPIFEGAKFEFMNQGELNEYFAKGFPVVTDPTSILKENGWIVERIEIEP